MKCCIVRIQVAYVLDHRKRINVEHQSIRLVFKCSKDCSLLSNGVLAVAAHVISMLSFLLMTRFKTFEVVLALKSCPNRFL